MLDSETSTTRRTMLKRLGTGAFGAAGVASMAGTASAQEDDEDGDTDRFTVNVFGDHKRVRVTEPNPVGSVDVWLDGEWEPVVEKFQPFIALEDDYAGVKMNTAENVETMGKLALGAAIAGVVGYIPSSGASSLLLGAAGFLATAIIGSFIDADEFTFGIRDYEWWKVSGHGYVAKMDWDEKVAGTIPLGKPESGEAFDE